MIAAAVIIGLFSGSLLVFAAREGCVRDAMGGIVLAVLVAIAMALSLTLIGCTSAPRDGWVNIPVDFAPYSQEVTPLSQAGCDGR